MDVQRHQGDGRVSLARPRRLVLIVLSAGLLGYVASLLPGVRDADHPYLPWLDGWANNALIAAAGGLCLLRAGRRRAERAAWALLGTAVLVYLAGNAYYYAVLAALPESEVPYPSWADAGWLAWYPFVYAGMFLLVKARLGRVPTTVWLDGLTAGAGAAAVAGALLLRPLLALGDAGTAGSLAVVTNLAYPVADLFLLGIVVCACNLHGWRPGRCWALLTGAFGVLFAGDTGYLVQVANGTYRDGGLLDATWTITFVGVGLAAWCPDRERTAPAQTRASLLVPSALSLAGTLVLFAGAAQALPLAVCLAGLLAVLLATARLLLTLVESQRLAQARLEARTDELTGLANRRSFLEALHQRATGGAGHGVLLMDLDGFKQVNDSLGHTVGDELLRIVGRRLREHVSSADVQVARLGGDEFAILAPGSSTELLGLAHRVRDVIDQPIELAGLTLSVGVSVGVTHTFAGVQLATEARSGPRAWESALAEADMAMYVAKRARTGVELFDPHRDRDGINTAALLAELRRALQSDALELHYQPQVDLRDGVVRGVEALVRWRHPERGLLVPASFLPVAIEAGLSRALTDTVLRQATAQLAGWHAAGLRVDVSVNLTQADVADPALGDRVVAACATAGVDPAWLVLEVTETTVGADDPHAVQRLAALRALGCRVSLDDFGTGQSSLSYLSRLPLDEVKLDRSFLSGLLSNPAAVTVVRGTTELVHGLGLRLVAEGVEEADVLTAITALGCDAVQGYHTGRPMAAGALTPLLQQAPRTDLVTAAGGTQVAVTA